MAEKRRRERRPPEFWRELVAAQPGSGRTVAEFCAARGVGQAGFYAWRKRLAAEPARAPKRTATPGPAPKRTAAPGRAPKRTAAAGRAAGFAAVRVTGDSRSATADARPATAFAAAVVDVVEVVLPGGMALRAPTGCDAEWLAGLAAALRRQQDTPALRGAGC